MVTLATAVTIEPHTAVEVDTGVAGSNDCHCWLRHANGALFDNFYIKDGTIRFVLQNHYTVALTVSKIWFYEVPEPAVKLIES